MTIMSFDLDSISTTSGLGHWHPGSSYDPEDLLWDHSKYQPSLREFIWDCMAFAAVYWFIYTFTYHIHNWKFTWFKNFSENDKYQWNSRIVSTIHAVLSSYLCLIHIIDSYSSGIYFSWVQRLFTSHSYLHFVVAHTTGYMLYDTIGIINDKATEKMMFLHHFGFIGGSFLFKMTGFGYHYLMFPIMTEMTTPFLNLRYFMAVLGYKGLFYKMNIILLWILWMIVRVAFSMMYLGYLILLDFFEVPSHLRLSDHFFWSYLGLLIGLGVVFVINGVWGYMLTTRIYNSLMREPPTKSPSVESESESSKKGKSL